MSEPPLAESYKQWLNGIQKPYTSRCCGATQYLSWAYSTDEYPDEVDVACASCGRVDVHDHDPDAPSPEDHATEVYRRV